MQPALLQSHRLRPGTRISETKLWMIYELCLPPLPLPILDEQKETAASVKQVRNGFVQSRSPAMPGCNFQARPETQLRIDFQRARWASRS